MKKVFVLGVVGLCAVALGLGVAVAKEKMPDKPLKVHIEGGKKPGVTFDHQVHMDKNPELKDKCDTCHHKGVDSKDNAKCTKCHGLEEDGDKIKIQDAMHKKDVGVCRSCHFGDEAKKKLKCAECHVKE